MCDCRSLRRAADDLNVRPKLLRALADAGKVDHHVHNGRAHITRAGLMELRWHLAMAQATSPA